MSEEETYLSLWKGAIPRPIPRPMPRDIIRTVADYYGLTEQDLTGDSRKRAVVHARQAAMYALRKQTRLSLPHIGRFLGDKDHSTVVWGIGQHAKRLAEAEAAARAEAA